VKLLLDEMYPARLSHALRDRGVDAEGVDERSQLRGLADEELLVVAAREGRALVSENVSDFMRLYGEWGSTRRRHAGIVIALSSRFSRTSAGYEVFIDSLAELCEQRPESEALSDAVHFLVRA
jgi:xanthine dehydrogenase iron-sulfur cluster and FAD-binding subunit A